MIFKTKKPVINNPDEMILHLASGRQDRYGRGLAKADPETLAKALSHFDLKTTCTILTALPMAQVAKVVGFLAPSRKEAIIERMPSQFAATLMESFLT